MSLATMLGQQIADRSFVAAENVQIRRCFLNEAIADAFCERWRQLGGVVDKRTKVDKQHWIVWASRNSQS